VAKLRSFNNSVIWSDYHLSHMVFSTPP